MGQGAFIVGIAGGSCSGKSTLSHYLLGHFGSDQCALIMQDDYYYGLSDAPKGEGGSNFDHPRAVRFALLAEQLGALRCGQAVDKPRYDFTAHMPMAHSERVAPRPLILLDGTLILHDERVRAMIDYAAFVRASEPVRFARRLARDVAERGRTAESIREQFTRFVAPMHERFVEPSAAQADVLIDNDGEPPAPFADRPMVQRMIAAIGKKLAATTVS